MVAMTAMTPAVQVNSNNSSLRAINAVSTFCRMWPGCRTVYYAVHETSTDLHLCVIFLQSSHTHKGFHPSVLLLTLQLSISVSNGMHQSKIATSRRDISDMTTLWNMFREKTYSKRKYVQRENMFKENTCSRRTHVQRENMFSFPWNWSPKFSAFPPPKWNSATFCMHLSPFFYEHFFCLKTFYQGNNWLLHFKGITHHCMSCLIKRLQPTSFFFMSYILTSDPVLLILYFWSHTRLFHQADKITPQT